MSDRAPRVIPSCGHTLCTNCLVEMLGNPFSFQCPLDKVVNCKTSGQTVDSFPINYALQELLNLNSPGYNPWRNFEEERARSQTQDDIESEPSDENLIYSLRSPKNQKPFRLFQEEVEEKLQLLKNTLELMMEWETKFLDALNESVKGMLMAVTQNFQEMIADLKRKENDIRDKIKDFFKSEKAGISALVGEGWPMRKQINHMISVLESGNICQISEFNLSSINPSLDHNTFHNELQSLECRLYSAQQDLHNTLRPTEGKN